MIAVVVRQGAETDVADARQWYTREGHHLGIAFVEEFARTVERIRARPDQFPEVAVTYAGHCSIDFPTQRISSDVSIELS